MFKFCLYRTVGKLLPLFSNFIKPRPLCNHWCDISVYIAPLVRYKQFFGGAPVRYKQFLYRTEGAWLRWCGIVTP